MCWPPLTGLCMVESPVSLLSQFLSQFEEVALCEASSSGEFDLHMMYCLIIRLCCYFLAALVPAAI